MTVPQPFQYQGSKRALAPLILQYLPLSTTRLPACARLRRGYPVETFCSAMAGLCSAVRPGCGFKHRPGACYRNWRRDAAATRRRGRLRYDGQFSS